MNTVEKGNSFEGKCYHLLYKLINNYDLSCIPSHCKVFEKKKIYSTKRKKNIIYDLVIEVSNPNAKVKNPILRFIVECKDLEGRVPVDDLEEFCYKVSGIENGQTKKIFIAKNGFSEGAINTARTEGVMLVDVNEEDYDIQFHKTERKKEENLSVNEEIEDLIRKALLPDKIDGLKKLTAEAIEDITHEFINSFNPHHLKYFKPIPLESLIEWMGSNHNVSIELSSDLKNRKGEEVLGHYSLKKRKITISKSINETIRLPFVIAHEIGHFVLHSNLKVSQFAYDNFKDSYRSLFTEKYILNNDKAWIEWQANYFASCLLMPKKSVIAALISYQIEEGIRNPGKIYLDGQETNKNTYRDTIEALARYFCVSKTSMQYRLESLKIVENSSDQRDINGKEFLRKLSLDNDRS